MEVSNSGMLMGFFLSKLVTLLNAVRLGQSLLNEDFKVYHSEISSFLSSAMIQVVILFFEVNVRVDLSWELT